MENYQFTKIGRIRVKETMEIQSNQKTIKRMALLSPYITNNNCKYKWTEFTIRRQSD